MAGPTAAAVVASAALIATCAAWFPAINPAEAPSGQPRHAGRKPMSTFILPGPTVNTGGSGWETGSVVLAAGPVGILFCLRIKFLDIQLTVGKAVSNNVTGLFRFDEKLIDVAEQCFQLTGVTRR